MAEKKERKKNRKKDDKGRKNAKTRKKTCWPDLRTETCKGEYEIEKMKSSPSTPGPTSKGNRGSKEPGADFNKPHKGGGEKKSLGGGKE